MPERTRRYIDVREPFEYAAGHIQGAELVPLKALSKEAATWDRGTPLTMVCRSGHRAARARDMLVGMHFEDVEVLRGGILRWRSEGNPVITSRGVQVSSPRFGGMLEVLAIVGSLALAFFVSPWFLGLAVLVGIKLMFAR